MHFDGPAKIRVLHFHLFQSFPTKSPKGAQILIPHTMNQTDQEGGKTVPESLLGGQGSLGDSMVCTVAGDQIRFSLNQGFVQKWQSGGVIRKVAIKKDHDFLFGIFDDRSHISEGGKAG